MMATDFIWQGKHFIPWGVASMSRGFRIHLDVQARVNHPSALRSITIRQLHLPSGWGKPIIVYPPHSGVEEVLPLIELLQLALHICSDIDSFFAKPKEWLDQNMFSQTLFVVNGSMC